MRRPIMRTARWYLMGYLGGFVVGLGFFGVSVYYAAHSEGAVINVMLCFFGGVTGWFVGILISPSSAGQKQMFSEYGKAISAFLSGFVLAKLDRIFEQSMPGDQSGQHSDLLLLRMLLFSTTFVIAAVTMFAGRGFGYGEGFRDL